MKSLNEDVLQMAILGYQQVLLAINERMEEVRRELATRKGNQPAKPEAVAPTKKHRMSKAGRERIRQAQIKRWAAKRSNAAA